MEQTCSKLYLTDTITILKEMFSFIIYCSFQNNACIGSANECQFTFVVQEFYMAQKLKGTVTYMIKVSYQWSANIHVKYNM